MDVIMQYLNISQFITINEKVLMDREFHKFLYAGGVKLTLFSVKFLFNDLVENKILVAKASHLWYEIASNQYLLYGNKRTASAATREFIKINNFELHLDKEQEKSISWQISMGKITFLDLSKIIESSIYKM